MKSLGSSGPLTSLYSCFASQEKDGITRLFATPVVLTGRFYGHRVVHPRRADHTVRHNKGKRTSDICNSVLKLCMFWK